MRNAIVLIDNTPHPSLDLHTEHGLSIYFEADGKKWLVDVGASDKYHENALRLGIDVADVDFLLLSHAHFDHTGGLDHFLQANNKATVIMSVHIPGRRFYSNRLQRMRDISIDHAVVERHKHRFQLVSSNMKITENVSVVAHIAQKHALPKGNGTLVVADELGQRPDNFDHEIVLTVNTPSGVVVFSGCSHNGILNVLEACSSFLNRADFAACIGGTHLLDSVAPNQFETEDEISLIAWATASRYPGMKLITGHCTGADASRIFHQKLADNCMIFHSGMELWAEEQSR